MKAKNQVFAALAGSFGALEIFDGFLCGVEGGPWGLHHMLSLGCHTAFPHYQVGECAQTKSPSYRMIQGITDGCSIYKAAHGKVQKNADASFSKAKEVRLSTEYSWEKKKTAWRGNAGLNVKYSAFVHCQNMHRSRGSLVLCQQTPSLHAWTKVMPLEWSPPHPLQNPLSMFL